MKKNNNNVTRGDVSLPNEGCAESTDLAERNRMADALRKSEEKYDKVFGASPDIIVITSVTTGLILEVNHRVEAILEYSVEEILGQTTLGLGIWVYPARREEYIAQLMRDGFVRDFDAKMLTKSGRIIDVQLNGELIDLHGEKWIVGSIREVTDRKQAEARLRDREAQYRELFELSADALFLVDGETNQIIDVNHQTSMIYGYERDELLTLSSADISAEPEETNSRIREAILQPGEVFHIPYRVHRKKDGTVFPVEINARSLSREGHPVLLVACRDITGQKRMENALRESVAMLNHVGRVAHIGGWALDLVTNTLTWTREVYAIHEVEEDFQPMVETAVNFYTPESKPVIQKAIAQVIEDGTPFDLELEMITAKGKRIWVQALGSVYQMESGNAKMVSGTVQNITDRKRAEIYREMGREVLQALNEPGDFREVIQRVISIFKKCTGFDAVGLRLQSGEDFPYYDQQGFSDEFLLKENTLIEFAEDGGICRDQDGHACLECTCGLVLSGKTDPSNSLFTRGGSCWTNDSFSLLELPAEQDPRHRPRNQCIHEGYASVALIPIRSKDKIVGLLHFNDRRKDCLSLEIIELLEIVATHIGSAMMRKRAEVEEEKLQAQLAQAQKMESVGRLAGGVAHDINNMLQAIMGYTELALDQVPASVPLYSDLNAVMTSARRSADIVRQLLAFARKQSVVRKVLDVNQLVTDMLNLMERLLGENIELVWSPDPHLWQIKMDPAQIDQILTNLCVNSRDAIEDVGTIFIETRNVVFDQASCANHPERLAGEFVMLVVRDTGCGMSLETQSHLFEPFFTTKGLGTGTGLGLATVYGVVKQNNGFISVESAEGEGTTFKIYLPRHAIKGPVLSETDAVQVAGRGSETILLVEDEAAILKMTATVLERQGYVVLAAGTPGDAIRMAQDYPHTLDLLITDVIMPEMNGRELARNILTLYPDIRRLFMSGYTADVIAHHGVLNEGVHFIQKPFLVRDLLEKVRAVLTR